MRLERGGFALEYEDAGRGPAVLLAHSMTSNLRIWDPHVEALAERYRLVRWDNRGHGKSDSPPGPYSLEGFAEDAAALLDRLEIERVHFVGLSVGGMIAQAFALKYPQRLLSLTLVDTAGKYPPETVGKWTERAALVRREGIEPIARNVATNVFPPQFVAESPQVVERLVNLMRQADPEGYARVCEAVPALDYLGRLGTVRCPTLVVVGEKDKQLPVALSEQLRDAIPGARLVVVPGAGHFVPIERPREFTRTLETFIKSVN